MVLPLFIFFFINILGAFDILKLQCDFEAALHHTGSSMMENIGAMKLAPVDEIPDAAEKIATTVYAKHKAKSYLGEEYLDSSPIVGGSDGISFAESALSSDGDVIDIIATYKVHPRFGIAGFTDFGVESRFYGHAFTGYEPDSEVKTEGEESEEMVYITESGTAYHKSLNCSHLRLSIRRTPRGAVADLRNTDGAKYYPCEYCGHASGGTVFITNYGNRYHTNINCTGLKRSIRTVPISEAFGRRPCSQCAG